MDARSDPAKPIVVARAAAWGAAAAMAMSGMRTLTAGLGLIGDTPPEALSKQAAWGLFKEIPPDKRGAAMELSHWAIGAVAGAGFAVSPRWIQRRFLAGPVYGLLIWLAYEAGLAPALGLVHAQAQRPGERAAFAADHVLYGLVLARGLQQPES
jgi:hypothetical protein